MIVVSEDELADLHVGRRLEVEVGTFPLEVRNYFSCSRDTVYLTTFTINKILCKHGDHIDFTDLSNLPIILERGLWMSDSKNALQTVVSCQVGKVRFKVAMKVTRSRERNYVTTFHKTAKRQTMSLLKRGKVIRPAW